MKNCLVGIGVALLLLSGCSPQKTMETVTDVYIQPQQQPQQILLELPQYSYVPVMEAGETDKMYLCDGYTVCIQTLESGDLDRTLRQVTGYNRQQLQLQQIGDRYQCVYAAAGEEQTQVGRTCIIDDGAYHYALTVMAPAEQAGTLREEIQQIFQSFNVSLEPISTGS